MMRCLTFLVIAWLASACQPSAPPSHTTAADGSINAEPSSPQSSNDHAYPLLDWSALTPPNWDAMALLKDIDLSSMEDDDPRAFELLKDVRAQWNNAPVNPALDGKKVTMHGYLVPLDADMQRVKSFLLVPYFGACIHSPPPPSNQTIYVALTGDGLPLMGWDAFVSVSGQLTTQRNDSAYGVSGYQIQADIVKPIAETLQTQEAIH